MAEQVNIDILIKTANAATSIGEIKSSLRDLKSASLQVGEGSAEFIKLGQAAGQLQDKVNDVNDTIRVLAGNRTEQLTRSFTAVAQAGIGAFQAVAGAQAIFGEKNEDLQKQMVKLQGLLNLSQGITQFANIGQAAKDLKRVMVSLVPALFSAKVAQDGLNVSMSLNPIGAVITAVAALVSVYLLFIRDTDKAKKSQKELNEELDKGFSALNKNNNAIIALAKARGEKTFELEKDLLEKQLIAYDEAIKKRSIMSGAESEEEKKREKENNDFYFKLIEDRANTKRAIDILIAQRETDLREKAKKDDEEAFRNRQELTVNEIQRELDLANAKEASALEIRNLEIELNNAKIKELDAIRKYKGKLTFEEQEEYKNLKNQLLIIDANYRKKKEAEDEKEFALKSKKLKEEEQAEKDASQQLIQNRLKEKEISEKFNVSETEIEEFYARLTEENLKYSYEQKYKIIENYYDKLAKKREKDAKDEKEKWDEGIKKTQTVVEYEVLATNTLINLNNLATAIEMRNLKDGEQLSLEVQKKQFKRKKALAVVEAVINTQLAMISMLKDPGGIEGFVLAGIARLNGMLAVATILAQKFQPEGGYSSAPMSTPSLSQSASFGGGSIQSNPSSFSPNNNAISPNFFGTSGAFAGNNPLPVHAYVLEGELTDAQLRAERFRQRATMR